MFLVKFLVIAAACCSVTLSDDSKKKTLTTTAPAISANATANSTQMTSIGTSSAGTSTSTTLAPPKDIWTVPYAGSSGLMCILLSANITMTYNGSSELKSVSVTPAINKRQAVGNCDTGPDKQSITVIYSVNQTALNVTFNFVMDNKKYNMNSFSLKALIDGHPIDVTQNVSSFWSKDMDQLKSYRCNATETLYDGDSVAASSLRKLTVSDMLLEAFQNTSKVEFSNPEFDCSDDQAVSNLVPIIVGAALGALILIVLIAYLIGRKRGRRGYEQV